MTDRALVATGEAEMARTEIVPFSSGCEVFLQALAARTAHTRALYSHALAHGGAILELARGKGRKAQAGVGPVPLTQNEWLKAGRFGPDY